MRLAHEAELTRLGRSLSAIAHGELPVDGAGVLLHRVAGQVQGEGHLGVAEAVNELLEDIELAT